MKKANLLVVSLKIITYLYLDKDEIKEDLSDFSQNEQPNESKNLMY